jgi:hypothetical protein
MYIDRMPIKWSKDEQRQMIVELKQGHSIKSIAQKHDRSVIAIETRLQKIVYDAVSQGHKVSELKDIIGLDKEAIVKYYKAYLDFLKTNDLPISQMKTRSKKHSHKSDNTEKQSRHTSSHNNNDCEKDESKEKIERKLYRLKKLTYKLIVENKVLKKVIKTISTHDK